jgi:hypothetical protein
MTDLNEGPFYLANQQPPSAQAQDESVVLTLIVFAVDSRQRVREIQVAMSIADAKHAVVQLRDAAQKAMKHQRSMGAPISDDESKP